MTQSDAIFLSVLQGSQTVHVQKLEGRPLQLGRGPSNDLVLSDPDVSWHHAVVWVEHLRVWVRDLGSTNGTFLDGVRVYGAVLVPVGSTLKIGGTHLKVLAEGAAAPESNQAMTLAVEDEQSGLRIPIINDRFEIGSGEGASLRLGEGPSRIATLVVYPAQKPLHDREIWLGTDENEVILEVGQSFSVQQRRLRVIELPSSHSPTRVPIEERYPYRLTTTLDGATGPEAILEDLGSGLVYRVDAGNRAVLLFLLARQLVEDRKQKPNSEEVGWMTDEVVQAGIWGRGGDANKLHVLIHRLRAELKKANIDPWFIEKRQRYVRLRLAEALVK